MTKAIGLIETKGLIPSIEGLDAMLKAANVNFISSDKLGAGLITIVVSGDVGAVKAAVEAGQVAAEKVSRGSVHSRHVIPRPTEDVYKKLLSSKIEEKSLEVEDKKIDKINEDKDKLKDSNKEKLETFEETPNEDINIKKNEDEKLEEKPNREIEEVDLSDYKVSELRKIARKHDDFKIEGKTIAKANKQDLVDGLEDYFNNKE